MSHRGLCSACGLWYEQDHQHATDHDCLKATQAVMRELGQGIEDLIAREGNAREGSEDDVNEPKKPMVVRCNWCLAILTEPGALVFTTPDEAGRCNKIHVCVGCWCSCCSAKYESGVL